MYLRLKYEIQRAGYTIETFAPRIGVVEKTLRNKINEVTDFTWLECLAIRKELKTELPLEELFKKEDIPA